MTPTLLLSIIFGTAPAPIDVGHRKQLFIDYRFIAEHKRIELRAHPPQKLGILRDEKGQPLRRHIARVIDDGGRVSGAMGGRAFVLSLA